MNCIDSIDIHPIFTFFILNHNHSLELLPRFLLCLNTLVHRWSSISESHTDAVDHSSAADSSSQVAHELKRILIAELEDRKAQEQNHAAVTLLWYDIVFIYIILWCVLPMWLVWPWEDNSVLCDLESKDDQWSVLKNREGEQITAPIVVSLVESLVRNGQ